MNGFLLLNSEPEDELSVARNDDQGTEAGNIKIISCTQQQYYCW
jgi:hypothetical protein